MQLFLRYCWFEHPQMYHGNRRPLLPKYLKSAQASRTLTRKYMIHLQKSTINFLKLLFLEKNLYVECKLTINVLTFEPHLVWYLGRPTWNRCTDSSWYWQFIFILNSRTMLIITVAWLKQSFFRISGQLPYSRHYRAKPLFKNYILSFNIVT